MSPDRNYSFDTSAFINGRRDLLPPTTFPTVWTNIEAIIVSERIRSVDAVKHEIMQKDDDVSAWARDQRDLFVDLEEDIQAATRCVLAHHPRLMGVGGNRNAADPFVIGMALARDAIVVTEETMSGNVQKPRIPDVCRALNVECLNLVGFIEQQGWTF